ncbi:hypothetical protein [Pseudoduganella sp. GCM10020061]|uniref:hypothetical protein n=1 Tax=Pseudoduganella sp. GCM10020061 TaxID=3317345 RepID=UPI003635840E
MMAKTAQILLALAFLAGCSSHLRAPADTPVIAAPASVAAADAALAQAARDRLALEAAYARSEAECYERFFVNRCLDQAKETRRQGLVVVRAIEVEMERYKRQAAVDERDRKVAQAEADYAAEEAARAAEPPPPPRAAPEPLPERAPGISLAERKARQDAKLKAIAERERAEAPKRAAKAAEFERKQQESARRQAEIAAKKAEKAKQAK